MNEFLMRAIKIIRNQTGRGMYECKIAFEQTHSIKGAIDQLKHQPRPLMHKSYDGQVI